MANVCFIFHKSFINIAIIEDISYNICSRCLSLTQCFIVLFPAVRTCFVSDLQRGLKIQEAKFNLDGTAQVTGVLFVYVCIK